jgi:hypothetical protein
VIGWKEIWETRFAGLSDGTEHGTYRHNLYASTKYQRRSPLAKALLSHSIEDFDGERRTMLFAMSFAGICGESEWCRFL